MGWRTVGVVAAAVVVATTAATPAVADTLEWTVSALPMPPGLAGASGYLEAHDGHGGYVASVHAPQGNAIVTWRNGEPTAHDLPTGQDSVLVLGESRDDTILLSTPDHLLLTLDDSGYHQLPTPPSTFADWGVIGPDGDIVITAMAADGSTSVQHSTVAQPGWWQPVAGVTPRSTAIAIDNDGSVLMSGPNGSYVLRGRLGRHLSAPAGPAAHPPSGSRITNGVVVGTGYPTARGYTQALEWTAPGRAPLVLNGGAAATDVNANGVVVGVATASTPVVWSQGVDATDLPLPAGRDAGVPAGVDDDGTVVGNVWTQDDGITYPVVWRH
jgi:hypothetical protein